MRTPASPRQKTITVYAVLCLVVILLFIVVEFRPWVNYWLAIASPLVLLIAPFAVGYIYILVPNAKEHYRGALAGCFFVVLLGLFWFAHHEQILVRLLFPYYAKQFDTMDRTLEYWPPGSNIGPFPIYLTRHDDRGGFWVSTGSTIDFPVDNRNYGFVYRPSEPKDPRDEATPFGSNWIYLRHIHGDWYSFAVAD